MWFRTAQALIKASTREESAFIAFFLPKTARAVFRHINNLEDDLHMTVVYITDGVKTNEDKEKILSAVEEITSKYEPLFCQFTEIGIMKDEDKTHVANVNLTNGAEFYSDLVRCIEERWHPFKREYNFLPHVSLQYNPDKSSVEIKDLRKYKWEANEITVQFGYRGEKTTFKLSGSE